MIGRKCRGGCPFSLIYLADFIYELAFVRIWIFDSHFPPFFSVVFISVAARAVLHPPALYFAQRPETAEPSHQ